MNKLTDLHLHTTWCDGADTPAAMAEAAFRRGFAVIGFSAHAAFPTVYPGALAPERAGDYASAIRELAAEYRGRMEIRLGFEADYIPGVTAPERQRYAEFKPDYLIGSVHFVTAPDGAQVPVDDTPELLNAGIATHFGGKAEAFIRAYFRQERAMAADFDFDILGHLDLVRKFNVRHPYFDETADWYREELELTAAAVAATGKRVEINTGGISRGWLDDAYPSAAFRAVLTRCHAQFLLSSDAHAAQQIGAFFDRFA